MSTLGRKVILARFHQGVHIPGIGELGNVLPSQHKNLELDMCVTETGVLVRVLGPRIKAELLIPSANVVAMQLAPQEVKTQTANKPVSVKVA